MNQLTGSLPTLLPTKITWISFSHNSFATVGSHGLDGLMALLDLQTVHMGYNRMDGVMNFQGLPTGLVSLDMGMNTLEGELSDVDDSSNHHEGFMNITDLILANNFFNGM